jgi:release factor glutamine methyltransferase
MGGVGWPRLVNSLISEYQVKSIQELFEIGKGLLGGSSEADSGIEARILLCKSAAIGEEEFYADRGRELTRGQEREFLRLVEERLKGVPLSYLTGEKEFWSLRFEVRRGVLIPRPESELVVEKVVELCSKTPKPTSEGGETKELIADIGTGSGNIAVALAKELPEVEILASDISKTALKVAQKNAQNLGIPNVAFVHGSLFTPLDRFKLQGNCDFIVSNPPYVTEEDWKTLQPEVRDYEPKQALVAGKTGLEFIQKLVKGAPAYLKPGGYLVFEIGYGQKEDVLSLFSKSDKWISVDCHDDLSGIPRVVVAQIF